MRFVNRKTPSTGTTSPARARAPGKPKAGMRNQPQWLSDWIDSKPRYVLLACGHKHNRAVRGSLIIEGIRNTFKHAEMFCDTCQSFQLIERVMKFAEYHGIQLPIETDLPPF